MTDDPLNTYRTAREEFRAKPGLMTSQYLMLAATDAWMTGALGDASYVRDALEPVRSYLLAGNTPMRDGKPELTQPQYPAPYLWPEA